MRGRRFEGLAFSICASVLGASAIARVRFLDLGAGSGYLLGFGLYEAGANGKDNAQAALGCAAIGEVVGLASSFFFTRSMQDDRLGGRRAPPSTIDSITPTVLPLDHGAAFGIRGTLME